MSGKEHLLAAFIADFKKGKKSGDPMEYARACKELADVYGSTQRVAEKLGVGKETIRILSKVTELPTEVQRLISSQKLPLTVAFDLVPFNSNLQIELAEAVAGLPSKEARMIIRFASTSPEKPVSSIRAEVLDDLEKREINLAMIALPKGIFNLLEKESNDVPKLISHIVEEWLETNDSLDDYSCLAQKQDLVSLTIKLPHKAFGKLRRMTRKPANLVEQIVITRLKRKGMIK